MVHVEDLTGTIERLNQPATDQWKCCRVDGLGANQPHVLHVTYLRSAFPQRRDGMEVLYTLT
jgi:hypothetical protein